MVASKACPVGPREPPMFEVLPWLLASNEPWTRYRTLIDLLDRPRSDAEVQAARAEMLAHPQVQALMAGTAAWGEQCLKRHNDASHPLHKFSTLADFGVQASDPGMEIGLEAVLSHQSPQGAFQTLLNIAKAFGGSDEDAWAWISCDAPTLLYALLAMGLGDDPRVQRAVDHLVRLTAENGWHCVAAPELGKFKGPGRRSDPCPIANVYALKALAQVPELVDSPASRNGVEMLLEHWERQQERRPFLFGIGTGFRKLKYPFVWYDVLHVVDVLSHFPFACVDTRLHQMVETITTQADEDSRFRATSIYLAWKGWSFADKRNPSSWLTFLVLRALRRMEVKE
jgi:hypothetical protein